MRTNAIQPDIMEVQTKAIQPDIMEMRTKARIENIGGCRGTMGGCCLDGITPAGRDGKKNCRGCRGTKGGCCNDGKTFARNKKDADTNTGSCSPDLVAGRKYNINERRI